jgi:hypothetical protein
MRLAREATELRQFFAIKTDLATAVRDAVADDIDFHLGELATMRLHTTSARLRAACRGALFSRIPRKSAVNA